MADRDDDERQKLTMMLADAPPGSDCNLLYCISNVEHPAKPAQRYFGVKTMNIPLDQGEYRYRTAGSLMSPEYALGGGLLLARVLVRQHPFAARAGRTPTT